jgi:hypothetical protein
MYASICKLHVTSVSKIRHLRRICRQSAQAGGPVNKQRSTDRTKARQRLVFPHSGAARRLA